MSRTVWTALRWSVWTTAALLLALQLFTPPVVGLSDQGDFARVIGRFGYAREDKATPLADAYVAPKYVRDPPARFPELEQPTSEYIFVATALLLNKLVSRDGKLEIVVMGFVHAAAFLAAFARLLWVVRSQVLVWILAAVALTDVGYVAYWNSFYSEPASCIFFLLLLAESIAICEAANQSRAGLQPRARPPGRALLVVLRWSLWAVLLVIAKPQNFVLAVLLVPLVLRIGWSSMWGRRFRLPVRSEVGLRVWGRRFRLPVRSEVRLRVWGRRFRLPVRSEVRLRVWGRRFRLPVRPSFRSQALRLATASGAIAITIASVTSLSTFPRANLWATTYNQIFLAILPDSKDRAADLSDLGIDARFATYAGTGAWTQRTAIQELVSDGVVGHKVTPVTVTRFYLRHPARMWRRAKAFLPLAFSLRPEWCGNFERNAGYPPGTKSKSFAIWSAFHERILAPIGKWILILLLASPFAAAWAWFRMPAQRMKIEFCAVLALACLAAFGVAAFGDAWDNVKHCFLFNLLLDTCLITAVCLLYNAASRLIVKSTSPVNRRAPQ